MRSFLIIAFLLVFGLGAHDSEGRMPPVSKDTDRLLLKVGTVAPASTAWAELLESMSERVSQESDGKLRFEIGYGGSLGGERELVRLCQDGRVAIVGVSSTIVAEQIPELNVLEMPYLFNSTKEADYIIDEIVGPLVSPKLEKLGLILLFWSENGFKNLASSRAIKTIDDMKGLAVRSQQSAVYQAMFDAFGMTTIPLGVNEITHGLQSGIIQSFDNSPLFTYSSGLFHYIKNYLLTEHSFQPVLLLVSQKALERIPVEVRQKLFNHKDYFTHVGRELVRKGQLDALTKLKEAGVNIVNLDVEHKAALISAAQALYVKPDTLLGKDGATLLRRIMDELENRRKLK
jgi:TRAP-type C4-dicarboxylate transport system substrate-binding protein